MKLLEDLEKLVKAVEILNKPDAETKLIIDQEKRRLHGGRTDQG